VLAATYNPKYLRMANQEENIPARKPPAGAELGIASELFDAGHVYVIDLFTIRVSSGVLWERTQAGVFERLKSILQRLVPSATHQLGGVDRTRCVVTMADISPEEGAKVCVRTAYELVSGLLGRCDLGDIHVSRADWDLQEGMRLRRLTGERLVAIAEEARLSESGSSRPVGRKSGPCVDSEKPRDNPHAALAPSREISAKYGFEPMWEARSQAVCMYFCAATSIAVTHEPESTLALDDLSAKERITLDIGDLLVGVENLSKCVERGDLFFLNVPISFETLSSPVGRTELSQICRGVLPVYREFLFFTLTQVPLGVSTTRLSDLVMSLRPFGRVIATVASGGRNYAPYQNVGLTGIALELPAGPADPSRVQSDILHLAAASGRFKLGAVLYGIQDSEVLALAHAADVRVFHGPAVGKSLDSPRRMTHRPRNVIVPDAQNAGEEDWF
jgi:hypothetical protein